MLQSIRSHAGSWLIKFLLGAIIASFALWGISDIIRGYGSSRPVATVGSASISLEEFSYAYKQAISNFQRMTKQPLTPEQIKEFGLAKQVLDSMIYKAALDQELKSLGLTASDATIRQQIQSIPAFLTQNGTFDKNAFTQVLRSQGLTEGKFVGEIRSELQQYQLFDGLSGALTLSDDYVKVLQKALEQPFQFVTLDIPFKKMALPKAVSDGELKEFFEANKEQFRRPEHRSFSILRFERDVLKRNIKITQEELQEEYNRRSEELSTAEKRSVQHLFVPTDKGTTKALDAFKKGKSFKEIAKEFKVQHKEYGLVTKDRFAPEHSNKIFDLDLNTPEVVETSGGWLIFVVDKIESGIKRPFNEVKADLEAKLKEERFNELFEQMQNQIEDALAGGEKLQEIAQKNGLPVESYSGVDKSGHNDTGKAALEDSVRQDVMDFVFGNAKDADSNMILAKGNDPKLVGVIVRVDGIQEASIPDLSSIKHKVTEAYKADVQNKIASTLAKEISQKIKTIQDIRKIAAEKGLVVANMPAISRATVDQNKGIKNDLPRESIERMFALSKGENIVTPTKVGFKIIMMEKALEYTPSSEKFTKFKGMAAEMVKKDFTQMYRDYLLARYPVSINQAQMDHVVGH